MKKEIFTSIPEEDLKDLVQGCVRSEIEKIVDQKSKKQELIKAKEACSFLKVSKVTLFKWLKEGKIQGYYLGTRLYFKQSELEESLSKKEGRDGTRK